MSDTCMLWQMFEGPISDFIVHISDLQKCKLRVYVQNVSQTYIKDSGVHLFTFLSRVVVRNMMHVVLCSCWCFCWCLSLFFLLLLIVFVYFSGYVCVCVLFCLLLFLFLFTCYYCHSIFLNGKSCRLGLNSFFLMASPSVRFVILFF